MSIFDFFKKKEPEIIHHVSPYQYKYKCHSCNTLYNKLYDLCSKCGAEHNMRQKIGRVCWDISEKSNTWPEYFEEIDEVLEGGCFNIEWVNKK